MEKKNNGASIFSLKERLAFALFHVSVGDGGVYHSMRCHGVQYRKPTRGQCLHLLKNCAARTMPKAASVQSMSISPVALKSEGLCGIEYVPE